jgi:hypothetical protein
MNRMAKLWQKLTPSQRLWVEVFGLYGLPKLDGIRVLAIVDRLPPGEARAIRLRFGFEGDPLSYEELRKRLLRLDGRQVLSRETARLAVKKAIRHLGQPSWRKDWEEARI